MGGLRKETLAGFAIWQLRFLSKNPFLPPLDNDISILIHHILYPDMIFQNKNYQRMS